MISEFNEVLKARYTYFEDKIMENSNVYKKKKHDCHVTGLKLKVVLLMLPDAHCHYQSSI